MHRVVLVRNVLARGLLPVKLLLVGISLWDVRGGELLLLVVRVCRWRRVGLVSSGIWNCKITLRWVVAVVGCTIALVRIPIPNILWRRWTVVRRVSAVGSLWRIRTTCRGLAIGLWISLGRWLRVTPVPTLLIRLWNGITVLAIVGRRVHHIPLIWARSARDTWVSTHL